MKSKYFSIIDGNTVRNKTKSCYEVINGILYFADWTGLSTGLDWTGLVKRGLVKHGLVKRGLVKRGLVKRGLVKRGLVKMK